ncbi:1-acyl-sn-glycerol-3-phosphate acyltransferase [Flagellimonas zhangzhouensis]|uniref:1-acyl-sn-glycerol-3-phosphate acyltransferases n=1 Tax=Flagellimonas zhangzhouensis TaxID=1073328 RepID=A0A1H2XVW3_9FLAO|nr:1-acyl-sn-glycerol-3-phosphate acyltransferase [Allomuricauda zhangzhouensis]SDQ92000.1 1-acyl-sn-glycerol-3-phosphate acyltransferases [Allomuricauda zhangzhouensis]SDW96748.1 1-acyl-sn-glycerol-3-phosphate acyltransferases [Allomuricauda zhangzhouensis]
MQRIARFIYFKLLGWKLNGDFPNLDKCVVIVVPHTHWLDFFLGLLIRKVIKEEINYIGKKSLFKPPFGWFFRWTGGAPVDRSKNSNTVDAIVQIFNERKVFRFALAPEGTRKKVDKLRTGFYHIAQKANVPIVMVAFDFGKKEIKIGKPFFTSDDPANDFEKIHEFYKGVKGKIPEYSF